ncbi:MAG: hypothetical protein IPG02_17480 [Ignavibacteria bacterium]|nr:hypothetical protein [Ignavibacteria bacterium]
MGFRTSPTNGGATWRQAYLNIADQNPMNLPTPKGKSYRGWSRKHKLLVA